MSTAQARTARTPMNETASARRASARVPLRRVLVPAEHGSWGFLAEPLLLGLAVAPTGAGLLVAVAVVAAFLGRQPLKLVWTDRRKGRRYPRTVAAERALALMGIVATASGATALALAGPSLLLPLVLATPAAALALASDLANRGRSWPAELAAPAALTATATSVALAGGWAHAPAFALWGVLLCRALPSVLYVRARLRLERGTGDSARGSTAVALIAQAAGLLAAFSLAVRGPASWLAVLAVGGLGLRAAVGLSPLRRPVTARRVGLTEIAYGLVFVAAVAAGFHAGL